MYYHNLNLLTPTNSGATSSIKLVSKILEGEKIKVKDEDCLDVEKYWGCALIGYVGGSSLGIKAIKDEMVKWKVNSKLRIHPSAWLIQNQDELRSSSILDGVPYFIFNFLLLLKIMPQDFDYRDEEIFKVPIWIKLPFLPLSLWTKKALRKISSKVGTPLTTNLFTQNREHIAYARLLMEVDVWI